MRKQYIYLDMDGMLADFFAEKNAVERFKDEPSFFYNLQPIFSNLATAKKLLANNNLSVRVLSKSPNKQADKDKIAWLEKWLPELPKNRIILIRNGEDKSQKMKTKHGILFDDYGKNCQEWLSKNGNIAFKVSPECNLEFWCKQLGLIA
jgi:5'(3')-deoxyribonucleotidase